MLCVRQTVVSVHQNEIGLLSRFLLYRLVMPVVSKPVVFRSFAKAKKGTASHVKTEEQQLQDASEDTTCKGANYMKTGEDPILKPDAEYPEWLWKLAAPPADPTTLSPYDKTYWRRLRKKQAHERNLQQKQRRR